MQRQHVKHVEDFQIQGVAFAEEDYLKTAQSTGSTTEKICSIVVILLYMT